MPIKSFNELTRKAKSMSPKGISVAAAEDKEVIEGVLFAMEAGIVAKPVLTGDSSKIEALLIEAGADLKKFDIRRASNHADSAKIAVKAVRDGDSDMLLKGKLDTVYYLKAILNSENGIKKSAVLSNLTLFEMESYHKMIAVTDNAIIAFPTLEEKKAIIENTKVLWNALEIDMPKVAILAAIEVINPAMQATVDAACLCTMAKRGQIKGFELDGPLSYDTAIDAEAAKGKKLSKSDVAGDPDLLLMPNLEAANMIGKSYKFHGNADSGGLVMGASAPVVLNSRSDNAHRRFNSIVMARLIAEEH